MKFRRIIISLLALCLISTTVFGQFANVGRDRYSGPIGPADIKYKNALVVEPGNYKVAATLPGAYDWLASSDRDGQMGALSRDNRRVLILSPGTYTLTATLTLDTDFVDIMALASSIDATVVTADIADETLEQTVMNANLTGFTIKAVQQSQHAFLLSNENRGDTATVSGTTLTKTGIGVGLKSTPDNPSSSLLGIDNYRERPDQVYLWGGSVTDGWYFVAEVTSDNEVELSTAPGNSSGDVNYSAISQQSHYCSMKFRNDYSDTIGNTPSRDESPVMCKGNMGGLWEFCDGGDYGFRVENPSGTFSGTLDAAAAVDQGSNVVRIPITGHDIRVGAIINFTDTTNYDTTRYTVVATATDTVDIESIFNAETFAGTDAWATNVSDVRSIMLYCRGGVGAFGGDMGADVSGTFIGCTAGDIGFGGCSGTGMDCSGEFYNCRAGERSFALGRIFSGRAENCRGNAMCFGGGGSNTQPGQFTGTAINCSVGFDDYNIAGSINFRDSFGQGTLSVAQNNFTKTTGTLVNCEIRETAGEADATYPTRARITQTFDADCINCHPKAPTAVTESGVEIAQFDNGHTYTNAGASAAVTLDLPPARIGLSYTFVRVEVAATKDVIINPQGADAIVQLDGTDLGNGDAYQNVADAYGEITLACRVANKWQELRSIGTWVDASP